MQYKNVTPSYLPSFLLPCPYCGSKLAITAVTPARYPDDTASNDLEDITHTCVQCGTKLTSTRPFSDDAHDIAKGHDIREASRHCTN
jgi:hypothetical protein